MRMLDVPASPAEVPQPALGCAGCIYGGRKVGPRGNPKAKIVVVGESPGAMELAKGKCFIGPSGDFLFDMLRKVLPYGANIEEEVFITNALQCHPRRKEPHTLMASCRQCSDRLLNEIKAHPRDIIIAMGNPALWITTGDYTLKITQQRGKRFPSPLAKYGIVAATHPAFILRGGDQPKRFREDLEYAIGLTKGETTKRYIEAARTILTTPSQVRALVERIKRLPAGTKVACDLETGGFSARMQEILCAGFCWDPHRAYIVPEGLIIPELFQDHVKWVWHNGKFDIQFLWEEGIPHARVDEDTMLMSYALNENRGAHDLEQVGNDWLGSPNYKAMLDSYLPKRDASYRVIPKPVLYKYLGLDVSITLQLGHRLWERLSEDSDLVKLYRTHLIPAANFLAQVETNGFYVDKEQIQRNLDTMEPEVSAIEAELSRLSIKYCGADVNPRSPKQLQHLLYEVLKLGRPGSSTDVDTLEGLPEHPYVKLLLKYRKVHKGLSTYVRSLPAMVEPDGCVHSQFLLHGTTTGRLASRGPNLQNQPRLPAIRSQFAARPGRILLEVDLNQAELRSLACMSGDPEMVKIYTTEGMSIHDEMRASIWGYPKDWDEATWQRYMQEFYCAREHVVGEQKMRAKAVNFGIVYGRTNASIAEEFEIDRHTAQGWIDTWFKRFKVAHGFIMRCRAAATAGRTITTCYGRKRRFNVVTRERLNHLQNEAANFPHQSVASDVMLEGGYSLEPTLRKEYDGKVVNLVHDSMIVDLPNDPQVYKAAGRLICARLEEIPPTKGMTRVPFKAEAKIGYQWGNLKGLDLAA